MAFSKYLLSLSSVLVLSACGYAVESSNQDITFLTPDAQDAKCFAYVDKLKYQVFPPQTLNIKKSYKDMEIICNAPGNRRVEMSVPAQLSKRALWGGPAGMAWDFASQSSHYYPSIIAIDFSQEILKPNALPRHNNSDIRQPETYDLEEFKASEPRLNSDKHIEEQPILLRGAGSVSEYYIEESTESVGEKSALQAVLEELSDSSEDVVQTIPTTEDILAEEVITSDDIPVNEAPIPLYAGE